MAHGETRFRVHGRFVDHGIQGIGQVVGHDADQRRVATANTESKRPCSPSAAGGVTSGMKPMIPTSTKITPPPAGEAVYFDLFRLTLVQWPATATVPAALLLLVLGALAWPLLSGALGLAVGALLQYRRDAERCSCALPRERRCTP